MVRYKKGTVGRAPMERRVHQVRSALRQARRQPHVWLRPGRFKWIAVNSSPGLMRPRQLTETTGRGNRQVWTGHRDRWTRVERVAMTITGVRRPLQKMARPSQQLPRKGF